jgi:hypothetical protein
MAFGPVVFSTLGIFVALWLKLSGGFFFLLDLLFVLVRSHTGEFFKGFIKGSHGVEANVVSHGGIFPVHPPGTLQYLLGFFNSVIIDEIGKILVQFIIEQLG